MKIYILFLLIFVTACSTLSKKECAGMNWEARGNSDGRNGEPLALLEEYKKDCSRHGHVTDETLYKKGHFMGLTHFCTYDQGFELGWMGKKVFKDCEGINPEFFTGFEDGHKKWMAYLDSELRRRRDFGRRGPPGAGRLMN